MKEAKPQEKGEEQEKENEKSNSSSEQIVKTERKRSDDLPTLHLLQIKEDIKRTESTEKKSKDRKEVERKIEKKE